jgi:hypothetical protein
MSFRPLQAEMYLAFFSYLAPNKIPRHGGSGCQLKSREPHVGIIWAEGVKNVTNILQRDEILDQKSEIKSLFQEPIPYLFSSGRVRVKSGYLGRCGILHLLYPTGKLTSPLSYCLLITMFAYFYLCWV